jgi:hypothetical protein
MEFFKKKHSLQLIASRQFASKYLNHKYSNYLF